MIRGLQEFRELAWGTVRLQMDAARWEARGEHKTGYEA